MSHLLENLTQRLLNTTSFWGYRMFLEDKKDKKDKYRFIY